MAYCTNCGNELQEGVRFCTNCGTPVGSLQSADETQGFIQPQQQVIYVKRKPQTKEEKDEYNKYMKYSAELKTAEATYGSYDAIMTNYGKASSSLQSATQRRDAFLAQNKNSSDETKQKLSKKADLGGLGIAGFVIMIIGVIMLFNACSHTDSSGLNSAGWFFTLLGVGLLAIEFYKNDKAKKELRAYDADFDKLESEVEEYTSKKSSLQPLVDKITFVTNYEKTHPEVNQP